MLKPQVRMVVAQGVSHLDAEMGALRNLLTNTAVLVNALKEVAQPSLKPAAAQPKPDGSVNGSRVDMDWGQTTDGLRCGRSPNNRHLCKAWWSHNGHSTWSCNSKSDETVEGGPMHWMRSTQR